MDPPPPDAPWQEEAPCVESEVPVAPPDVCCLSEQSSLNGIICSIVARHCTHFFIKLEQPEGKKKGVKSKRTRCRYEFKTLEG